MWHQESCASRIANPSRGQFGREARLVLQTEELDLLALLVYLLSLEVDKVRAEVERAVEARFVIVFVSQLVELSASSTAAALAVQVLRPRQRVKDELRQFLVQ